MDVTTIEIEDRQWKADEADRTPEERGFGARARSQMERRRSDHDVASPARCLRPFRGSEPRYACASGRPVAQRNGRSGAFSKPPHAAQADLVNVRFAAHYGLKPD